MILFIIPKTPPNIRLSQPNIAIFNVFVIIFETKRNKRFVPTNNIKKLTRLTTDSGNDGKKLRI